MKKILIVILISLFILGCSSNSNIKLISTKSNIINILLSDVNAKESGLDGAAYEFSSNIDSVKLNVQVSDYQGNEIANVDLDEFNNDSNKKFVFSTGFSNDKGYVAFIQNDNIVHSESFYLNDMNINEELIYVKQSGYAANLKGQSSNIHNKVLDDISTNQQFTIAYTIYTVEEFKKNDKAYFSSNKQDQHTKKQLQQGDYLVTVNLIYN